MLPSKVSCYFRTFESTFVLSYFRTVHSYEGTFVHTKVLSYYIVRKYFRTFKVLSYFRTFVHTKILLSYFRTYFRTKVRKYGSTKVLPYLRTEIIRIKIKTYNLREYSTCTRTVRVVVQVHFLRATCTAVRVRVHVHNCTRTFIMDRYFKK